MSWVTPAIGGVEAVTGKKGQQQAQNTANNLSKQQIAQIKAAMPLIQQGEQRALQYDPHAETEQALNSFDQAANASATSDYGNAQLPLSLRGFNAGNASTDSSGYMKDVAAQRGANRGALAATLQSGEYGKKQNALSGALAPAFSASNALAGPQANAQNLANGWNPSGAINAIGSFPWDSLFKKKKSDSSPFDMGNYDTGNWASTAPGSYTP